MPPCPFFRLRETLNMFKKMPQQPLKHQDNWGSQTGKTMKKSAIGSCFGLDWSLGHVKSFKETYYDQEWITLSNGYNYLMLLNRRLNEKVCVLNFFPTLCNCWHQLKVCSQFQWLLLVEGRQGTSCTTTNKGITLFKIVIRGGKSLVLGLEP